MSADQRNSEPIESLPAHPRIGARHSPARSGTISLTFWERAVWILAGSGALFAAYTLPHAGFLVLVYLFALIHLARSTTWRGAFYSGLALGMVVAVSCLGFFWRIFSAGAIILWIIFAFWLGLFVAFARLCITRAGMAEGGAVIGTGPGWRNRAGWVLVPFIWCGLEYFRSELYYLRFAWLTPGFAFSDFPGQVPLHLVGTYGVGFLLAGVAAAAVFVWESTRPGAVGVLLAGAAGLRLAGMLIGTPTETPQRASVQVAGVQLEFPSEPEVIRKLNQLVQDHPDAQLLVLSEYTFSEPVPQKVKDWCRTHQRYLVIGGTEPAPGGKYYNTAFVVSPTGEIVFRQVKSVPIQFFKDGLPAPQQTLWESPWGRIGFCICYDLSYSRVTDRLVNLGAQALIVPTMDVADWGQPQHRLHARIAPVRAAEYGVPIFRVASSGISQALARDGRTVASAPFPGEGASLAAALEFRNPGSLPLDRWLGPLSVGVTLLVCLWSLVNQVCRPRDLSPVC